MPGLSWDDLESVDFKKFKVSWQVEEAIKNLRKAPKILLDDEIISDEFFQQTDEIMSEAVWSDVKNAILRCSGPQVPSHLPAHKEEPMALNIESLGKVLAVMKWLTSAGKEMSKEEAEQKVMLEVLSRCVFERIGVIRSTLVTAPKDWWIRLILNDLHAYVALGSVPDLPT